MKKKTTKKTAAKKIPCLITNTHRGVYFGYVGVSKIDDEILEVERCRNCYMWIAGADKGIFGLSTAGPQSGSKISKPVRLARIRNIACVVECTAEATEAWERAAWSA